MRVRGMLAGLALAAGLTGCSGGGGLPANPDDVCRDPSTGKVVDLSTDANNCGTCHHVCPTLLNASPVCYAGQCQRGPCNPGWQDLTSDPGCETPTTTLSETGLVFCALTAGASFDVPQAQTAQHYLQGSIGEPTPAVDQGEVEAHSAGHRNISGFNAILH